MAKKRKGGTPPTETTGKRTRTVQTPVDMNANSLQALPTSEDWVFRLKVLCSSTTLDDDVLRGAVQGLVKICFPDGVLEELGVDVITAHMHEQGASKDNIDKMQNIFRSLMIHRMAGMLAPHLDTAEKLDVGVKAVISAAKSLHGQQLDDGAEEDEADQVATIIEHDETLHDASEDETTPPPKKKKMETKTSTKKNISKARALPAPDADEEAMSS